MEPEEQMRNGRGWMLILYGTVVSVNTVLTATEELVAAIGSRLGKGGLRRLLLGHLISHN